MKYFTSVEAVLTAQGANGTGTTINVEDWEEIWVEVSSASSANLILSFVGSGSETAPDFSAAISGSNHYSQLAFTDVNTVASELPDSTSGAGLTFTGTDQFKIYKMLNATGIRTFTAKVASWAAGNVTVKAWGVKTKHV